MKKSEWIELAKYLHFLKKMKQGKYEHIEELIQIVNSTLFTAGVEEVKVKENDIKPPVPFVRNNGEKDNSTTNPSNNTDGSIWF